VLTLCAYHALYNRSLSMHSEIGLRRVFCIAGSFAGCLLSLLSSALERLPPTRVLLAAGFVLASYFVTSVWKETIDARIRDYSEIISKASAMEARLTGLPMSQASFSYLAEMIGLQKFQIELTNKWASTDYRLAPTFNPHVDLAIRSRNRSRNSLAIYLRTSSPYPPNQASLNSSKSGC
jgi:hypothetical protein